MNKKLLSTALAVMVAGSCLADDVPALKISKSDGESAVVLSELLSIKFTESDMVVNMKDGTQQTIALDDIIVMELGQAPTAISSLFSGAEAYVITDLQGKVVSKGNGDKFIMPTQKGIYVITVGDKSKKVLVK